MLTVATPPSTEPISRTEAKLHLRVDHDDENTLIDGLISAARELVENRIRRALITQTLHLYLDEFPVRCNPSPAFPYYRSGEIELQKSPVQTTGFEVHYIASGASDNTYTQLASTEFKLDHISSPARLTPEYGKVWPATKQTNNAVKIVYVAGYGAAAAVPAPIRQAMLLLIDTWYEQRGAAIIGSQVNEYPLPAAVNALLAPYKVWRAGTL